MLFGTISPINAEIEEITLVDFTLQNTPARETTHEFISQDGVTITSPVLLQTTWFNGLGTVGTFGFLTQGQTITFSFDQPKLHVAYLLQGNDFDNDGKPNEHTLEVFDIEGNLVSSVQPPLDFLNGHRLLIVSPSDFSNGTQISKFTITANDDRFRIEKIAFGDNLAFEQKEFCGKPEQDFNIILGTSENDYLKGTKNNDLIFGFTGADIIIGLNGDDCLVGGDGNDLVFGGNGNDMIFGEDENDVIYGNKGNDIIYSSKVFFSTNSWEEIFIDFTHTQDNGHGFNTILGGAGNDSIYGSDEEESLFGGTGDDMIFGNHGSDKIFGGTGNDVLSGGDSEDLILGGKGDDSIDGGERDDLCFDKRNTVFKNCEIIP